MDRNVTLYDIPGGLLAEFVKPGVYGFILNEKKYLYIGEASGSMLNRIAEHMKVMCKEADEKWWGILSDDLKSGKLSISVVAIEDEKDSDDIKWSDKEFFL